MIDLKINAIFPFEGRLYKVVKSTKTCKDCAAYCDTSLCEKFRRLIVCNKNSKKDGNEVSFIQLPINREPINIGSSRTINDMKIRPLKDSSFDKCINCVFCNTCVRNNSDTTFAFIVQNYFGECDFVGRNDDNSVIFGLSGTNTFASISDKLSTEEVKEEFNNKVESLFNARYDIEVNCKSLQINLPTGRIIDEDKSDLNEGIIYFKDKYYLNYEDDILGGLGTSAIKYDGGNEIIQNTVKLLNIINYYNLYFKVKEIKKCIIKKGKNVYFTDFTNVPDKSPFVLKSKEIADEILENPEFRDILDKVSRYNVINNEKDNQTKK